MAGTTWNPSDKDSAITLSNGNLTGQNTLGPNAERAARAVDFKSAGKFYFEVVASFGTGSPSPSVGLSNASEALGGIIGGNAGSYAFRWMTGQKRTNASNSSYGVSLGDDDVLGIAVDFNAGALWFSKNGVWMASATIGEIEAGTTTHAAFTGVSGSLAPSFSVDNDAAAPTVTLRSSPGDLTETVPTGFTAGWPAINSGAGAVSVPLQVSGTGKVLPVHGTAAASLPFSVSGTGKVLPIHGTMEIALPLSASGEGSLPGKGQVGITMGLSVVATGIVGRSGVLEAAFPNGFLRGELVGFVHVAGALDMRGGALAAALVGTAGVGGTVDALLGTLSAELSGTVAVLGTLAGAGGTLGAALVGYQPVSGTLDAALRGPRAYLVGTLGEGETWHIAVMNLSTGAITEYDAGYAFNSFIEWDGAYYGANETGIYRLAGDLDGEAEIAARARTARTDHDTELTKRPSDVYVIGKSATRMLFRVVADEAGATVYEYSVPMHLHSGMDSVKATLGRGLRERFFQYEIANVDGADFECDGFDIVIRPQVNRRKR